MIHNAESNIQFVEETSDMHFSHGVQKFIEQETVRPSKHWVHDVVWNKRESDSVKLRTEDFVLLPDTNASRRQWRPAGRVLPQQAGKMSLLPRWAGKFQQVHDAHDIDKGGLKNDAASQQCFSWLAIVLDDRLRSMRDLRGSDVAMLERLQDSCLKAIEKETGVEAHKIMTYVNYPPSVYRLHIHFCAPFSGSSAFDAFRMHPISNVINNLKINPEYYRVSNFRIPVHCNSDLFRALDISGRQHSDGQSETEDDDF